MKKIGLAIIICVIVTIFVGAWAFCATAYSFPLDVGNYNNYSGGSHSGGHSSGGSYGGNSGGDFVFDPGWLILLFSKNPVVCTIIVGVIIACVVFGVRCGKFKFLGTDGKHDGESSRPIPLDHTGEISAAIRKIDPNFSSDTFITWSKDVFITLQQAWTARDWSTIRPFEKEELFEQHKRQLDEYIRNHTINIIERINVGQTHLHRYERDAQYEYLTVYMSTRMVDYIIEEDTKKVLKGNPSADCYMNYLLTFMRKTGVKTREGTDRAVSKTCPNCGAPLSITSSGKCDYCGSIITTGDFDWVLAKMDAVTQDSVIDNCGVVINDKDDDGEDLNDNGDSPGRVSFDDMLNGDDD